MTQNAPQPLSILENTPAPISSPTFMSSLLEYATPSNLLLVSLLGVLVLLLVIQAARRARFRSQLALNPAQCAISSLAGSGLINPFPGRTDASQTSNDQLEGYLGESVLLAYQQRCCSKARP